VSSRRTFDHIMLATRIRHTGKLRRNLRPEERWVYVCVLTIAGEAAPRGAFLIGGQEPTAADLADEAAVSLPVACKALGLIRHLGLLELGEDGVWWVPDFAANHQPPSPSYQIRLARIDGRRGLLAERIAFYGGRCWMCRTARWEHIDHVKPLARGGAHILANLRPACAACNHRKGSSWPVPERLVSR